MSWPIVSLTVLNPSRSPKNSATVWARPAQPGQGVLDPVVQEGSVGEPGQLVVESQVPQIRLEGVALAVRRLEGSGVDLELVGLPGDAADQPHHAEVDERGHGERQSSHEGDVDRQAQSARHHQDAGRDEPREGDEGQTALPGHVALVDVRHPFGLDADGLADRGMQGGHAHQHEPEEVPSVGRAARSIVTVYGEDARR